MRRIVHLSDMHCPPDKPAQADRLVEAVLAAKPDLTVVTGDLTRGGGRKEFESARKLLERLPLPHLIVPGNHDVPLFNLMARFASPFRRFQQHIATFSPETHIDDELAIVGLNTARGVQARLNWSMGVASPRAMTRALNLLRSAPVKAVRILASHHPIATDPRDPMRSSTRGAARALSLAATHGIAIVMHGHLHRARVEKVATDGRDVIVIGAGTALSDRERGDPASFNLIELSRSGVDVTEMQFDRHTFCPGRKWHATIGPEEQTLEAIAV